MFTMLFDAQPCAPSTVEHHGRLALPSRVAPLDFDGPGRNEDGEALEFARPGHCRGGGGRQRGQLGSDKSAWITY